MLLAAEEVAKARELKSAEETTPSRNEGGVVSGERSIEDKTERAVVAKSVVEETCTSYDGDNDYGEIQKTPPMVRSVLAGRYRKSVSRESGDRLVDSLNHSKASNQSRDSNKDSKSPFQEEQQESTKSPFKKEKRESTKLLFKKEKRELQERPFKEEQ